MEKSGVQVAQNRAQQAYEGNGSESRAKNDPCQGFAQRRATERQVVQNTQSGGHGIRTHNGFRGN
jgi:hypothetical protein